MTLINMATLSQASKFAEKALFPKQKIFMVIVNNKQYQIDYRCGREECSDAWVLVAMVWAKLLG